MDRWILSRLNTLVKSVGDFLDHYDITGAGLAIEEFTDELSNWYVRRNRSRFWAEELTDDKKAAYNTLYEVLTTLSTIAAPFVPFMTEEIYQNLVRGLDESAEESIHLTYWPEYHEEQVDAELEQKMETAYSLVKLGRYARNQAVIKNRQPLQSILISERELPEYYGEIIKDELNIKEVKLGADLSQYVIFEIKPNLPVLGKTYGKLIPAIRKAIAEQNQMELAQNVLAGKDVVLKIGEEEISLNQDNLLVTMQGLEGFAFAGEGERGVVLDTTITPELKEEGYLREVISKIQNLRKDSGLEVSDRIEITLNSGELIADVFKKYEEIIARETLADKINYLPVEGETAEVNINGEMINLAVEKAK
jgi:isoleucyl-tRNA synthetase